MTGNSPNSPASQSSEKKTKVRVTITAVVEYEMDPKNYPEETRHDPKAMLAIDMQGAEEDIFLFVDSDRTKWLPVKGEIVNG